MKYTLLLLTPLLLTGCQGKNYWELTPAEKAEVRAMHDKSANVSRKCNRIKNQFERTDCFLDRNDDDFNRMY